MLATLDTLLSARTGNFWSKTCTEVVQFEAALGLKLLKRLCDVTLVKCNKEITTSCARICKMNLELEFTCTEVVQFEAALGLTKIIGTRAQKFEVFW